MNNITIEERVLTPQYKNFNVARSLIQTELEGLFGTNTLRDLKDILNLYNVYENGADFTPETNGDYVPSTHKYKHIKSLIDKEARFLFSVPPVITIHPVEERKELEAPTQETQYLVDTVFKSNHVSSKLVRTAKDCLIGKRVALAVDFNEQGIQLSFMPSLEFIYETDPTNVDKMTKFIRFYSTVVNDDKSQQRVYKKKWELNERGYCEITEELYDGSGNLVETISEPFETEFTYIPVWVVINGGLIGDPFGTSDVEELADDESWYSRLGGKDMDSLRKGADQIIWAMDVHPKSTKNLSRAAGAFWDLSTDPASPEGTKGSVGVLDNDMSYSAAMDMTLKRLRASMYSNLDIPDTTSEALTGIVSSGKTMEAIYWGLMVRCDEKLLDWIPALEGLVRCIVEGSRLYPDSKKVYTDAELLEEFSIDIENTYPILKDETEQKATNISEVNNKVMSRRTYMKKWRGLTDDQITAELKDIAEEQQLLEGDNYLADVKGLFGKVAGEGGENDDDNSSSKE
jgi:hypothetical protein